MAHRLLAQAGPPAHVISEVTLTGAPPASRVVVPVFDSLGKAQAAYTAPAHLEARRFGDRYARLRPFASEGLPR